MSREVAFTPEWLTFEIEQALNRIETPNVRKKRTTVLRLAEARATGRSMTETFKRPDVCSEATWRGQYRKGERRPGWADDPVIQEALKLATARAQAWEDTRIARNIAKAQRQLAEYAPAMALKLYQLGLGAKSESLQRQAALDILDRAGAGEVASKATVPSMGGEQVVKFDLDGLPVEVLRALVNEGEPGEPAGGGEESPGTG